jgi:hypothetical protein
MAAVKVFARQLHNFQYFYSCNVCCVDVGSETGMEYHLKDRTHLALMKLDVLPYRSFMRNAIFDDDDREMQV